MKFQKRLAALLLVLVLSAFCFIACSSDEESEAPTEDNYVQKDYGTATVYSPWDRVQIITENATATEPILNEIDRMTRYGSHGGAYIGSLYSNNEKLEVLVGIEDIDGSRPIIAKAKQLLERIERDSVFEARYVIYADGGQVAIVYDKNEYTNLQPVEYIVDDFVERYLAGKEYFAVPRGILMTGSIDLIKIQEEIDTVLLAEEWEKLEGLLGKSITNAMRKVYSMYDDKMVKWAANLYDPGTGGFYTCRTGRNGEEFGPDVECTVQILRFITSSGMLDNLDGGLEDHLPMSMQQQLIYFAKSIQDPSSGYFYHPQWGTDISLSRRGRDLGWGTSLLSMFGARPAYNAPNGTGGDGITADEYWDALEANGEALSARPYPCTMSPTEGSFLNSKLTSSLGEGASQSVAKLVSSEKSADSSTAYLQTHESFINYLLTTVGPQLDSNPYSGGNNLNATYSQIASYSTKNGIYTYSAGDEAACTDIALALSQFKVNKDSDPSNDMTIADIYMFFDGMDMKEITIAYLNEKINPEIGLWGLTTNSNPTGTEFMFTNGFFKVSSLYNSWKVPYPAEYIEMATDALMTGLLGDQPSTGNICEVYNIWTAIGHLQHNLRYLDDSIIATDKDGNTIYDASGKPVPLKTQIENKVNDILYDKAADALINTYNKISAYKMEDGGFNHTVKITSDGYATQQGAHTGYKQQGQSNIDATCIGTTGLVGNIYTAFGIGSAYKVSIFTESDWMVMLDIFLNLDPVIKYSMQEEIAVDPVITFEGEYSQSLKVTTNDAFKTLNTWEVVKVDGNEKLFINKDGKDTSGVTYNGGTVLTLKVTQKDVNPKYMVCEFDIRYENIVGFDSQITINHFNGTGKANSPFLFTLPKNMAGQELHIIITYEVTERDENGDPIAFKSYYQINNQVATVMDEPYKTSTNILNGKTALPEPSHISEIVISLNNSFLGDAYFDNLTLYQTSELPEALNIPTDIPAPDTPTTPDTPTPDPVIDPVITFDNAYSSALKISSNAEYGKENTWTVVTTDGNKELFIDKNATDTTSGKYLGGVSMNLKVTDREDGAKYAVCEFDVRFENVVAFASQIGINHNNGTKEVTGKSNSPFLFGLPQKPYDKTRHVVIIYEVTASDTDGTPTAFKATMYVDGALYDQTTELHKDATNLKNGTTALPKIESISSIDIALNNGFRGDAYFDNMSLKLLCELPAIESPEPDAPEHTHNFVEGKCECGASDPSYVAPEPEKETVISFDKDYSSSIVLETNAYFKESNTWTVVEVDGDKKLFINKTEKDTRPNSYLSGVALYLNVTEREENAKYMVCEFDVRFENVTAFDSQITINHGTYKGKENSPFLINLPKDKYGVSRHIVIVYEVTATDSEGKPSAMKTTCLVDGVVTVEYTEIYKTGTNIISGQTPIPAVTDVNRIIIALNNSFLGDAYYDNMSLKLLAELPESAKPSAPVEPEVPDEPEVEKEPVITFDKDYSDSLKITNNPQVAPLNTWEVVTVEGEKMLFINKCDSDTSGVTYNGGVSTKLSVTYREKNAKYMVYELDIYLLNVKSTASQMTLSHSGKQYKQNSPFLFTLPKSYTAGEKLHIVITYEVTATDASGTPTAFKAMYIINGKLIEEVTEIHKEANNIANGSTKLPTIDQIDNISFDLNNGCKAEAYIDNMSLKLLAELPELIVPEHTHNFVEGKCECGETDPNYVPPHTHSFVDGKCECGKTDPNYVPEHTHNFVEGKCECGESDPNYVSPDEPGEEPQDPPHEHNYVNGKCECGVSDPNSTPSGGSGQTGNIPNLDNGGWSKPED